jgi:molybdopterin/thiamine biosynthesis adenylyltransferase
LVGTEWHIDTGIYVDAIIRAHDHEYVVRMSYPNLFPAVPPTVRPLYADERWSAHQYGGSDGPLCLEWGPDNWHPDVTGAQMLESAYRLLNIENPLGTKTAELPVVAPSRHQQTIGQELRFRYGRFYVGHKLLSQLLSLPAATSGVFKFSRHVHKKSWVAIIHAAQGVGEAENLTDDSIPSSLRAVDEVTAGLFHRTDAKLDFDTKITTVDELQKLLASDGFDWNSLETDADLKALGVDGRPPWILIIDDSGAASFFVVFADNSVLALAQVLSEENDTAARMPENFKGLADKSVGIVGLGSVGSKIALCLARMGVQHLFLVDYDIFLPGNIQRHVLDWSNIGEHKAEAVRGMLSRINASIRVDVSCLHLTGQESTAAVSGVLDKLSALDLLIDATADASVFNMLAATAVAAKKPLAWVQVYAGGVGGMIARSRPGYDPKPQTMRLIYGQYCLEHPAPDTVARVNYTAEDTQGTISAATDTEVAIIANHAARLAADTLLNPAHSIYPYSMYLVGFAKWWVFSAPFHTIPIATDDFREKENDDSNATQEEVEGLNFVRSLLEKRSNAASPSS